jgi:hypothetical protein
MTAGALARAQIPRITLSHAATINQTREKRLNTAFPAKFRS